MKTKTVTSILLTAAILITAQPSPTFGQGKKKSPDKTNPKTPKLDGSKIEEDLTKNGLAGKQAIGILDKDISAHVKIDGLEVWFNSNNQWTGDPMVFRQTKDSKAFQLPVDIVARDSSGRAVQFMIPIGPGTIYMIYGEVHLFGHTIKASQEFPLVFVIHSVTGKRAGLGETSPDGSMKASITWELLGAPLFPTWADKPANASEAPTIQLVHISGKGSATLRDGSEISFADKKQK